MWGRMISCAPIAESAHEGVTNPPQVANLPHPIRLTHC